MSRSPIASLLAPASIAVVGASPDSWYASNLVENLHAYGFDGAVYYVNPGRETVWGEPCYDSIRDVPTVVDLVVVSVPRESVLETVRDAGDRGVPAALVITAGFAEADAEGERLEAELGTLGDEYDMAICGPNTIGFANTHDETVVTSTCSRKPGTGSIALLSQSGALAFTTFFERAADEDLDFAYIVATGNEAALSVTDYLDYLADEDRVNVVCLYLEGLEEPRGFMDAAAAAVRGGTPVLATKVGRSAVANRATLSHTGSVTGDAAAWDAAFRQCGVERVPDIPDLLGRAAAHAVFDPPASETVCIASTSGGLASLLADQAAERGLALPDIDGETERALLDLEELLTFGELHNPADIRGYGADVLPEVAEPLLADDAFDAYVFAVSLPAVGERAHEIADGMLAVRELADDPVLFLWTGRKAPEDGDRSPLPFERVRAETPLYSDPSRCLDALASLVRFGAVEPTVGHDVNVSAGRPSVAAAGPDSLPEDAVLTWAQSETLLDSVGIEPVETHLARTAEAASAVAADIGGPVVLKVDSPAIPHRTDHGLVALDVTEAAVAERFKDLSSRASEHASQGAVEGVLVQEQIPVENGTAVLVGVSTAEPFGPVLTIAPGGEFVELFDTETGTTLVPPVSPGTARNAIEASRLGDILGGHRGRPAGDIAALADLVSRVSVLVTEQERPPIAELDLNPVIVRPDGAGVAVVDVLVRTGGREDDEPGSSRQSGSPNCGR